MADPGRVWYRTAFVNAPLGNLSKLPPGLAAFGSDVTVRPTPSPNVPAATPRPHKPARPVAPAARGPTLVRRQIQLYVDLHSHSTASDGTDPPRQLVRRAKAAGLSALALTDHDTTAGIEEAADEARRVGLDFLPGIEISASYPRPGVMHLLGYGIDPQTPALRRLCERLQAARAERNEFLIDRLNSVGVRVDHDELVDVAGGPERSVCIGRPHFAKLLFLKGYIPHVNAAYKYYLSNTGHFRFDRREPEPGEAIAAVHAAGGVVSLAHPNQLRKQNFAQLACEVRHLADLGLDGIEVVYNDHRESFIAELQDLCRRHGLLTTGGSDYHGNVKKWIILGRCGMRRRVPRAYYDALLARLRPAAAAA